MNAKEAMADYSKLISNVPLFDGLPKEQVDAIGRIAVTKRYSKGQTIFSEGDKATGFFVIAEGRVKIYKVSAEGKEQILHIFEAGQSFGEVTVFTGQQMPANAQTLAKTHLLLFARNAFVDLVLSNSSLALNLLGIMSKKLRQFAAQIESLSLKEISFRRAGHPGRSRFRHIKRPAGQSSGNHSRNVISNIRQTSGAKFNSRRGSKN